MAMSEDALRQLLPVISSPLFLLASFVALAAVVVHLAWTAEKERERVEQLAARLRRLCQSTGRPAIRRRRLPLDVHAAILSVDRSLRALERDQGIRSRRLAPHLLFLEQKALIDNIEQRVSQLEGRGLR